MMIHKCVINIFRNVMIDDICIIHYMTYRARIRQVGISYMIIN